MTIIKDNESKIIAKSVKPDSKNRVVLPKDLIQEGITYHIYVNKHAQIILDPQMIVPLSELWIYENRDIIDSIDRGMAQSANGKAIKRGSFSKYVDDES
ncbi:hypothetical protein ACFLVJ_01350 [Chloroflexota bacterium]